MMISWHFNCSLRLNSKNDVGGVMFAMRKISVLMILPQFILACGKNQSNYSELHATNESSVSLTSLLQYSVDNSPVLKEHRAYVLGAKYGIDEENAARNPQINFQTSAGLFSGAVFSYTYSNVSVDTSTSFYDTTLTVRQTISDFGRSRWGGLAAALHEKAAIENYRVQVNGLIEAVTVAFMNTANLQDRISIKKYFIEIMDTYLNKATILHKNGVISESDLLSVKIQVNESKSEMLGLSRDYQNSIINLNKLSNQNFTDNKNTVFTSQELAVKEVPSLDSGIKDALSRRPELSMIDFGIRASEASLNRVLAENSPTLSVDGIAALTGDSQSANPSFGWGLFLTLSIPLYDGGITSAKTNQIRAATDALRAQKENLIREIKSEVEEAHVNLSSAFSDIELTQQTVKIAKENFDIVRKKFDLNQASIDDVIDSVAKYEELLLKRSQIELTYLTLLAQWKRMTSASLDVKIPSPNRTGVYLSGQSLVQP